MADNRHRTAMWMACAGLCLLTGWLTSAAIAIAAAIWTPMSTLRAAEPRATGLNWGAPVPDDWPPPTARTVYGSSIHSVIMYQVVHYADAEPANESEPRAQWLYEFGWPFRCLAMQLRHTPTQSFTTHWTTGEVPQWLRPSKQSLARWPLHPVWGGSIIDAVLFGLVWFSLYRGMIGLRGLKRLRAGRCPRCNYPCEASVGCPECGWNRQPLVEQRDPIPKD